MSTRHPLRVGVRSGLAFTIASWRHHIDVGGVVILEVVIEEVPVKGA